MKFKILIGILTILILIGCQQKAAPPAELPTEAPVIEEPIAPTEPTTPTVAEPVTTEPATTEPETPATTAADVEIIGREGFSPAELKVTAGSTVSWKNSDKVVHKLVLQGKSVNSGNMASGATWSYVFKDIGEYTVFDTTYNKRMKVTVE